VVKSSYNTVIVGVSGQTHAPAALPPRREILIDWVDPRTTLDAVPKCTKS